MYPTQPASGLITSFVQALLHGFYLATLVHALRWLLFEDEGWILRKNINRPVVTVATVMIFLFATLTLLLYFGIFLNDSHFLTGSATDMAVWIIVDLSELLTILTVDAVLIYRCWMVYGKSWRVLCVPALFWIGALVSAVLGQYYDISMLLADMNRSYWSSSLRALASLYVCNIATTAYATAVIAYRILSVTKDNKNHSRRLHNTARILAESGVLYSSMTVITFIASLVSARDPANELISLVYGILDATNFCTAIITFNLIIIRTYQNRNEPAAGFAVSFADSGNTEGEQTLSGLKFGVSQTTTDASFSNTSSSGIEGVSTEKI